ncbi:unnamed protein product [marine sediment metagenome]|uniref:Uncharacterized protein n=1 Tax=marine sediment metagenome TaxID=412755 RepID=X1LMP5_9ZZZZ
MTNTINNLETQIKITFENLIKIYSESSKLLLDASALLDKEGFYCPHGNTLGTNQSKNINNPADWITPYGARYFISDDHPKVLLGISIIFIGPRNHPVEPLVVFGKFEMKEEIKSNYEYYYLRHCWYHLCDSQELNKIHEIAASPDWYFKSVKLIGKKLMEIENLDSIKKIIIDPLVDLL